MNFLIPIPFGILSALIIVVSDKYDLNIVKTICQFVLLTSIVAFIYLFLSYYNFDYESILREFHLK